jgi:hypothetical protein
LILETNADVQQSKLYDMTGRLILKTSAEKEILVGTLAPGVYLLQVQSNGKNYRERFLKQ